MATREAEDATKPSMVGEELEEDDEHDSKEAVFQRYFLLEWKVVKSILDDIISNWRVVDLSSAHKIRSIVCFSYSFAFQISVTYYQNCFKLF